MNTQLQQLFGSEFISLGSTAHVTTLTDPVRQHKTMEALKLLETIVIHTSTYFTVRLVTNTPSMEQTFTTTKPMFIINIHGS